MITTETNSTISWLNEIAKYNARKSHRNITNNNNLPNMERFDKSINSTSMTLNYRSKIIPWPHARFGDVPRAVPLARSPCRFRMPTKESSPVPPSQTLGVLFFPLSPPSRKGATQEPEIK
jgi:hypothetical protein